MKKKIIKVTIFLICSISFTIYPMKQKAKLKVAWGASLREGRRSKGRKKPYMEDRFVVRELEQGYFFSIFDGHGGQRVVEFMRTTLPQVFAINMKIYKEPVKALQDAYAFVDILCKELMPRFNRQGTTVVSAFIEQKEGKIPMLTIAHVGDSRAVLVYKDGSYTVLTKDHKPKEPVEKQRIQEKLQEKVKQLETNRESLEEQLERLYKEPHNNRVKQTRIIEKIKKIVAQEKLTTRLLDCTLKIPRIAGLSVSRALGDIYKKELTNGAISAIPEISQISLTPNVEGIIFGTDGLWDVVSNKKAANAVCYVMKRHWLKNEIKEPEKEVSLTTSSGHRLIEKQGCNGVKLRLLDSIVLKKYPKDFQTLVAAYLLRNLAYHCGSKDNIGVGFIAFEQQKREGIDLKNQILEDCDKFLNYLKGHQVFQALPFLERFDLELNAVKTEYCKASLEQINRRIKLIRQIVVAQRTTSSDVSLYQRGAKITEKINRQLIIWNTKGKEKEE